jgi:hypothetical protein
MAESMKDTHRKGKGQHSGGAAAAAPPREEGSFDTTAGQLAYLGEAAANGTPTNAIRQKFEDDTKPWVGWRADCFDAFKAWHAAKDAAPSPEKLRAYALYILARNTYVVRSAAHSHDQSIHRVDTVFAEHWPAFYQLWLEVNRERPAQPGTGPASLDAIKALVGNPDDTNPEPTWALITYYLQPDSPEAQAILRSTFLRHGLKLQYLSCPASEIPEENERFEAEILTPRRQILTQLLSTLALSSEVQGFGTVFAIDVLTPYTLRDAGETTHCLQGLLTRLF